MSGPRPTTRRPTARSNAGTKPSKASASASRCRCPWTTPAASWPITSPITTHVRLHSAIGYVTPKDKLDGNDQAIFAARDRKLAEARERRKQLRQTQHERSNRSVTPAAASPGRPSTSPPSAPPSPSPPSCNCSASRPTSGRGAQQRGPCPLHGSTAGTSRCFSVNLDAAHLPLLQVRPLRQRPGPVGRTPHRQTPYDAAIDLCQRLNIPLPTLANQPEQGRGTRGSGTTDKYNDHRPDDASGLQLTNSTKRFFQFRLNHYSACREWHRRGASVAGGL